MIPIESDSDDDEEISSENFDIHRGSLFHHLTQSPPRNKKFGCCCNCCHVKQGVFILGILELFMDILLLAFIINRLHNHSKYQEYREKTRAPSSSSTSDTGSSIIGYGSRVDIGRTPGLQWDSSRELPDDLGLASVEDSGGILMGEDIDLSIGSGGVVGMMDLVVSPSVSSILCPFAANSSLCELETQLATVNYRTSDFSQNAAMIGDYIGTTLLTIWLFVVIMLFYAIFNRNPTCLIPHLFLQILTLLFCIVFFILFAWDYFYVELYTEGRPVMWPILVSRLWLLSIYAFITACEIYIFSFVLRCYNYLKDYRRRLNDVYL